MSTTHDPSTIGPELAGTYMSPDEFDTAEDWDEGFRYELINGVLIVTPPPAEGECGPNDLLGYLLRNYAEQHPSGSVLNYTLSEHTVSVGENRRRVDRVVWAGLGRIPNVRQEVPTIAVEFVGSRRRDRRRDYDVKREEYGRIGVSEYWIVDRFRRKLTAVRYKEGKEEELIVGEGTIYTTELLPGFDMPINRLFDEADMLEK